MVEVVTLDKNGGTERLEKALKIVGEGIVSRGGIYKKIQGPTRIGTHRNDDLDDGDLIDKFQGPESSNSEDEDNQEGIDLDLDELNDDIQVE